MKRIIKVTFFLLVLSTQIANACDTGNSYLTKEKWYQIKRLMRNSSITIARRATHKSDIDSIIGSSGSCKSLANGRIEDCTWVDINNCKKKIKAKFRDDELSIITKSGF